MSGRLEIKQEEITWTKRKEGKLEVTNDQVLFHNYLHKNTHICSSYVSPSSASKIIIHISFMWEKHETDKNNQITFYCKSHSLRTFRSWRPEINGDRRGS